MAPSMYAMRFSSLPVAIPFSVTRIGTPGQARWARRMAPPMARG